MTDLQTLIQADLDALSVVESCHQRLDQFWRDYPTLREMPGVELPSGAIVYSEEEIRAAMMAREPWHKPTAEAGEELTKELIGELQRKKSGFWSGRNKVGWKRASRDLNRAYDVAHHARQAVLAYRCSTLEEVMTKGKHLLAVIDKQDDYELREALESIVADDAPAAS